MEGPAVRSPGTGGVLDGFRPTPYPGCPAEMRAKCRSIHHLSLSVARGPQPNNSNEAPRARRCLSAKQETALVLPGGSRPTARRQEVRLRRDSPWRTCAATLSHPLRDWHQALNPSRPLPRAVGWPFHREVVRISGKMWPYLAQRAACR